MALNGIFYGTTNNSKVKPCILWSAVQNPAENYSDVTATLCYSRTNKGYTTMGTWEGSLFFGQQPFSGSRYLKITYDSNTEAISATCRVYHDSYGNCTLTLSASGAIPGTSLEETNISAQITLDPTPRASGVSATDGDIGSCSTVVIDRKNSSFTHTVAYRFGTLTGFINAGGGTAAEAVRLSATTVNFLLPEAFYDQIPDSSTGICTLTCTTYMGDTLIGESTATFTATANYSLCRPVLQPAVTDTNTAAVALTGGERLIRYFSDAGCTLQALPQKGAAIRTLRIQNTDVTEGTLTISGIGQERVSFEATDSRGYTTQATVTVPLIPYVLLTNNAQVQRTDPTSGNALLILSGACWKGSFGEAENALSATYSVNDGQPVSLSPELGEDHTYRLQLPLSGLDYDRSHTVTVTVTDRIGSVTKTLTLQKGLPVFDWGETDFRFHVPVELPALTIDGIPLADYIRNIIKEVNG